MRKTMNKRILVYALSIMMMLGIMPTTAFAAEETPEMFYDANANGIYEEGTDHIVTDLKEELQKEQDGTVIVTSGEYVLNEWGIEYFTALDVENSATVTIQEGWFYKEVSCGIYTGDGMLNLHNFSDGTGGSLNIYGKAVIQYADMWFNGGSVGENADLTIYGGNYFDEAAETFLGNDEYLAEGYEVYYADKLGSYAVRPAGITEVEVFRDFDGDLNYDSEWGDVPFRTLEDGLRINSLHTCVIGGEHVVGDGVYENGMFVQNGKITFEDGTFMEFLYFSPNTEAGQAVEVVINGGIFENAFHAFGNTKLTITDGTFKETLALNTSEEVMIAGGSFKNMLFVDGNAKITVTGGTFENWICYSQGAIDLSGHVDPAGITVYNEYGEFIPSKDTVLLPEGYVFYDEAGNEADVLMIGQIYTVGIDSTTVIASGTNGENVNWTLDAAGTLTVSGTGDMAGRYCNDYWGNYIDVLDIKKVIIREGITGIGQEQFSYHENLTSIEIAADVMSIEDDAFDKCTDLKTVNVPCKWNIEMLYDFGEGVTLNIAAHTNSTYEDNGNGTHTFICDVCGENEQSHEGDWIETTPAIPGKAGEESRKCVCGAVETRVVPALPINTENTGKVEDDTAENVTPEDKTDLENTKEDLVELNKPADSISPNTGDNSNIWLWISLLIYSSGVVITLTVVDKKRRCIAKH